MSIGSTPLHVPEHLLIMEVAIAGFDLDDVLLEFTRRYWEYSRRNHGLGVDDFDSIEKPYFNYILGCDYERGHDIYQELLNNEEEWAKFHDITPDPEALKALERLKASGIRLEIVTAREHHLEHITRDFINRCYPGIFTRIHLCNTYGRIGVKSTKSEMCLKHGIKLLVDDNISHIEDVERNGLIGIPFGKYSWSQRHDTVREWHELPDRILSLL